MPQRIVAGKTILGQSYEVNFENGIKVLNSENANYSFGSLHQIMLKGITEVLKLAQPENILMLGLGAGSALAIFNNKCRKPYKVAIIEIDQDLVNIATQHFGLNQYPNLEIIIGDAQNEIRKMKEKAFDFILDDIFWDNRMPEFCLTRDYLQNNCKLLTTSGVYMRNTMNILPEEELVFERHLQDVFSRYYHIKHSDHSNKIYFCYR